MTFSVGSSSVKKGESLRDTVLTIEAMGVDAIVVRHASAGVPWQIAGWLDDRVSVVNAGDGWHEHPTQALLDSYTIRAGARLPRRDAHRHRRRREAQPGRPLRRASPTPPSVPRSRSSRRRRCCRRRSTGWPVRVSHDLDAVLPDLDVVVPAADAEGAHDRAPGALAARVHGALRAHRFAASTPCGTTPSSCTPGPMNRGVEISAEVADLPALGDRRPGAQRRRHPHGRALPAARPGGRQGARPATT